MSETWKIQVSPKVGNTLINLRADDPAEALRMLGWLEENSPAIVRALGALETVAQAPDLAKMANKVIPETPPQTWQAGNQQVAYDGQAVAPVPQAPAPTPQQPPAPSCQHGPRVFRSGNARTGAWSAWFCPTPKGTPGQCDPIWNA